MPVRGSRIRLRRNFWEPDSSGVVHEPARYVAPSEIINRLTGENHMVDQQRAEIACNLCDRQEVTVLAQAGRDGKPLRTVACNVCGLVWSDPRPHDAREFYREHYRREYKNAFEPKARHVLRAGRVAAVRLAQIREWLRPARRVLDVGSGGGEFAYLLQKHGHAVDGVEPNRGYAGYAARQYGLHVHEGFIDEVELPGQHYDLITIWHVLEHTENPLGVLQRLRAALRSGGHLVVEVPNLEGPRRSRSSTFHEAHLYNFNDATLAALASRAGFDLVAMRPSADGGNLLAVFAPGQVRGLSEVLSGLAGNARRAVSSVLGHSVLRYWMSARPYLRLLRQCWRPVSEYAALWRAVPARQCLDELYAAALPRQSARRLLPVWPVVTAAYLFALIAEEALLDSYLPQQGWSEQQGFWLFSGLLACVAALAWLALRSSRSRRQLLGMGVFTAPLFALPIYC